MSETNPENLIDLLALSHAAQGNGPLWGCALDDLNLTLLSWDETGQIAPHINNEVDVVFIGVEGAGEVLISGQVFTLSPGQALLIPKGNERSVQSRSDKFSYLSIHRRRARLMPAPVNASHR